MTFKKVPFPFQEKRPTQIITLLFNISSGIPNTNIGKLLFKESH